MKVNDFVGIEKIKSGTGIELSSNAVISGGAYMPSMLLVENYDTEDWSPVFNPVVVKSFNMAIGYNATVTPDIENSIAFGNNVIPITSNTIQLGNWAQRVLTMQEGAYRLDERDMVEISESVIGLSFIDTLKPIKYRDQFRESSIDEKHPLPHPINEPEPPNREVYRIEAPDGSFYIDEVSYGEAVTEYERKLGVYQTYRAKLEGILAIRKGEYAGSGSVKGDYYNYAFKPTELLSAASAVDGDFKPVVGDITQYYKPTQLIVPLVKSIQEEHLLIKDLRTDVTTLQTQVGVIEVEMAGVKGSVESIVNDKLPDLADRLTSLESSSSDDGEPTDLSEVNQRIDSVNVRVDNLTTRVDGLVSGGGGGTGEGGEGGEGGDTSINRPITLSSAYPVYYNIINGETSKTHELLTFVPNVGLQFGTAVNIAIIGTRIDLKGWQVDLWSGDQVIKHLGSDFSPLRPDGRPRSTALGSDRSGEFYRWQTLFAISETNIFSDMRLKTEKISLQDREKKAAIEIKESIGLYKLLSSVDEKGDGARYHVGVYAQEVIAILEKYDLDPLNRYSFIGKDNHEKSGEDGYYNIRPAELALFLIAAL